MLGPYLSSFLLCVTSLDRYLAICRPFMTWGWEQRTSDVSYATKYPMYGFIGSKLCQVKCKFTLDNIVEPLTCTAWFP